MSKNKEKKLNNEKKQFFKSMLPIYIVVVVMLIMIPFEIYAWFGMRTPKLSENVSVNIISEKKESMVEYRIIKDYNQMHGEYDAFINPDDYIVVEMSLYNNYTYPIARRFYFLSMSIRYPKRDSANYQFKRKHIDTGCYYDATTNVPFNIASLGNETNQSNFFENFIAPVTNAISYEIYIEQNNEYHTTAYKTANTKFLTNLPNATTEEKINEDFNVLFSTAMPLYAIYNVGGNTSEFVTPEGCVIVPANLPKVDTTTPMKAYMLFYFNPYKYPSASNNVVLKNSNAFMAQEVKIEFDYRDTSL